MAHESSLTTIGDYFTLQRGTTYKSSLLGKPGPVLLGLATIQRNGGFRSDSLRTYGGESPGNLLVHPGELYVSLKDVTQSADLLGAIARLPNGYHPGRLTQDTVKLIPKLSDVPIAYVYWVLRTPQYRHYSRAHATGTTNLGFSREDFLAFPVPEKTPIRCQIVEILTALEDKIDLNRRMSETLETIARALFKSWFVDFDPVRAKAQGRDSGLPQPLADLFPARLVQSELGKTPEGWPVETLADHFEPVKGVSYKGSGLGEDGVPLHNLKSIYEGGGYKYEGIKYYSGEHAKRHVVLPGDVIVANTEQGHERLLIGYAAVVPSVYGNYGIASHHIYRVRPKPGSRLEASYLCFLLNSPQMHDLVSGFANGTTVNMLPIDALQKPPIVCPPRPLVGAFDALAMNARQRCEELLLESRTLASLRDLLLPKLISGEIRLRDAEKAVEAVA